MNGEILRAGASTVLIVILTGCSASKGYQQAYAQAEDRLAAAYAEPQSTTKPSLVQLDSGFFVPSLPMDGPEPDWGQQWTEFTFDSYPLQQALRELLLPEGVSVRLLDQIDPQQPVTLAFSGTLSEALQQISLLTGIYLQQGAQMVTARRFEMAEFDVAFLAGTTNFFLGEDTPAQRNTTQQSVLQTAPASEDSSQYLNFTSESLSVWNDLELALTLLLSAEGELAINQSSTSVLVRDYPQYVEQVRAYLLQQNQRLTRQVAVDVQIIDVSFTDSQQVGIDWDLVYQSTSGSGIVNFASSFAQANGGISNTAELGYARQGGRFDGSQVLIEALSQQGVVEVSTHPRVVSLNNQIAKIVLQDNATYLASAGSTATANVGSSDLLIPGVVTTGFELYVLPKVANQQVVMQLSTSLSDLIAIDQVTSGEKTIQTPHTNRKKFFMKAMVADGETLLISGLQNSRRHWREHRNLFSFLFGGRRDTTQLRSETLLLLTPRILPSADVL